MPELHLIVIGAGLCGFAAAISTRLSGHRVTLLESAKELAEVGAGLQLTPNSTRLFKRWGVFEVLAEKATVPETLSVHRYDGTALLAHDANFQAQIQQKYGVPFWDMHRVDLQYALAQRAKSLGIEVRLASRVIDVDFDAPAVVLEGGERIHGDVVLAADGLWSTTRDIFLRKPVPALPTGDLAYRIVLRYEDITDPEVREWVKKPAVHFWVGPYSHFTAYSVRRQEIFNCGLLCPDDLPEGVRRAEGGLEELKERVKGWDPILLKFINQVKAVDKWKLAHINELESWKNDAGTFVMAGDACHPMLPYLAQGANSALEDGAVLGCLLGKAKHKEQIPAALELYESLRKKRGEAIAKEAFKQREDFHMPDGPKQEARDARFLAQFEEPQASFPSRWTCPQVQPWLYGYDAYAEAERAFEEQPF